MKHLLKGLLYSSPWLVTGAVYTYFHMAARPVWYYSDLTIWIYVFVTGVAWTYFTDQSAHEEDRRDWEAMHTELNHRLIDQAVANHNANGHKREVQA